MIKDGRDTDGPKQFYGRELIQVSHKSDNIHRGIRWSTPQVSWGNRGSCCVSFEICSRTKDPKQIIQNNTLRIRHGRIMKDYSIIGNYQDTQIGHMESRETHSGWKDGRLDARGDRIGT